MLRIAKEDAISENNAHASEQAFFYGRKEGKNAILAFSFPSKKAKTAFSFPLQNPILAFFITLLLHD
jgi:hypothetical protein